MEKKTVIDEVILLEWNMFRTVNGEEQVDCQQNPDMFYAMRKAQFQVWPETALENYRQDLKRAEQEGRNLLREKYIRMMRITDPEAYEVLGRDLPEVSARREELAKAIWAVQERQTRKLRSDYPALGLLGRPMEAEEEEDWASVENYQLSELLTYSEETLETLLAHIREMERLGQDYVREIQENTVLCQGFASLDEAEAFARRTCRARTDGGVCSCDHGEVR